MDFGVSLLFVVCEFGYDLIVECLLGKGVDINCKNISFFYIVCEKGNYNIV